MKRVNTLEPGFREKILELIVRVEQKTGRLWRLSDGRRTIARQNELYAQGRIKSGKIVTKAKGGQSAHNFGLAADLWPMTYSGRFDWAADDALFKTMADIAVDMGLTAGYYFKSFHDAPHVEDPNWKDVQAAWRDGKIEVA